jgi:MFS family permease
MFKSSVPDSGAVNRTRERGNVLALAVCQALSLSGVVLVVSVSALAGQALAENKALATVPFALQFAAAMIATVPASLLMGRIGRRAGFTIGQSIGILGALVAAYGIYDNSFTIFAIGSAILGVHNAFWQYLRFAAADAAEEAFRPQAISYVLAGGLVAAVLGPEIAKATRDLFESVLFAGSYLAIVPLCLVNIAVLRFVRIPLPPASVKSRRPMVLIAREPAFIVAILAAMIAYGAMNLVMTSTPLAMNSAHFGFDDSAFIIQWHVLGMFAPSFITGHLIRRFGTSAIVIAGAFAMTLAVTANVSGETLWNYWFGLVLLGIGWNFMFIGGTTLLTEVHRPEERARVQALNDFLVMSTVTISSFASGALQHALGWTAVNLGIVVPVLIAFGAAVWLALLRHRANKAAM